MMPPTEPFDLSELSWHAAFAALCERFRADYIFTHWKAVDWDALEAQFGARVGEAQKRGDIKAYYRALREFVYAVPDANSRLWGDDWDLVKTESGGSFGLELVRLDDGELLVKSIATDGAARRAGIERGAHLFAWNGAPMPTALERTSVVWAEHSPPTRIRRVLEQCRLLTRAPIGAEARIRFQNPRAVKPDEVTLVAEASQPDEHPETVTWHTRGLLHCTAHSSGTGVIVLNALPEAPLAEFWQNTIYERFRESLLSLSRARVRALVLDLRGCVGLNHQLAARLAGLFHRQRLFYAVAGHKNLATRNPGSLKADSRSLIQVIPQDLYWRAPVAVLVSAQTMGAAEGLAQSIQNSAHGTIVSSTTSGGRFGQITDDPLVEVWLPEGYSITFQREAVLNQDGVIQIESNRFGEGGVRPNIRVPQNVRTFEERWLGGLDVELTFGIQALSHMVERHTRGAS